MHQFYKMYPKAEIAIQREPNIVESRITPQVGAQINESSVFLIPWGHNKLIIDKCNNNK